MAMGEDADDEMGARPLVATPDLGSRMGGWPIPKQSRARACPLRRGRRSAVALQPLAATNDVDGMSEWRFPPVALLQHLIRGS